MNLPQAREVVLALRAAGCQVWLTPAGRLMVRVPAVVASPSRLATLFAQLRTDVEGVTHAAFCARCGRDVCDAEDRQRLLGTNPFCSVGGCPFRNPVQEIADVE